MPVEVVDYLRILPGGVYADVTCGLGGHARLIRDQLSPEGCLVARDRDADSLDLARPKLETGAGRLIFDEGPFSTLRESLDRLGIPALDGLLADCGVSMYQLTSAERGFSITRPGPLDMRMSRKQELTAADIVNFSSEREIADIIVRNSEERRWRKLAGAIVRARPIYTTDRLAAVIEKAAAPRARRHPATLVFQALRIAVNQELDELEALMRQIPLCIRPGGRATVITFHSLEDRIVKRAFQELERQGKASILTRHVVRPTDQETDRNPAARSAKLRCMEMK